MVNLDKYLLLAAIIIGASLICGIFVYNNRYAQGYQRGIQGGFFNGNQTGYMIGIEEGSIEGSEQGEINGWKLGENIGYEEGLESGYATGYQDGVDFSYLNGYNNGYEIGSSTGYLSGVIEGSRNYVIRDPCYLEVEAFILSDETDKLVSNGDTYFYISEFRKSAYRNGYRCIWVEVKIENYDRNLNFGGFNTTDRGLIIVDCLNDNLLELEIGEPSLKPGYEGKIIEIILVS